MKYGFIGCGNMGGAIATALSKATKDFAVTDRSGKARLLAEQLGCLYTDTESILSECNTIFLSVKPQMMENVLAPLQGILQEKKPLVISMAAGLSVAKIEELCGTSLPVIRIMPNTPVAVGKGMIPYCCNSFVSNQMADEVVTDLRYAGKMDPIEESLMDVATALSGSGPAYMYFFLEALSESGAALGMSRDKALEYATLTMAGAAEMVMRSPLSPTELRKAVCSPGGSTIEGIQALENYAFADAVNKCIYAAYLKNLQLGK